MYTNKNYSQNNILKNKLFFRIYVFIYKLQQLFKIMEIKSRSITANINLMPNKKYDLIYLQCNDSLYY